MAPAPAHRDPFDAFDSLPSPEVESRKMVHELTAGMVEFASIAEASEEGGVFRGGLRSMRTIVCLRERCRKICGTVLVVSRPLTSSP